jgi:glycogenin
MQSNVDDNNNLNKQKQQNNNNRNYAYATLITSDDFFMGLQTMVFTLKQTSTLFPIIVLVTKQVSKHIISNIEKLSSPPTMSILVKKVEAIPNPSEKVHISGWVNSGYTKLHIWNLIEYDKIVYIDADTCVLENIDHLFSRPNLTAAPDVFPPDKFNAGVLIIEPSKDIFQDMQIKTFELKSYDGGDTGFLNAYFPNWYLLHSDHRLPFAYNAQRTLHWMTYEKQPGYWNSIKPIKILHFSSTPKPWNNAEKKGDLEMIWWQYYIQSQLLSCGGGTTTTTATTTTNNTMSNNLSGLLSGF